MDDIKIQAECMLTHTPNPVMIGILAFGQKHYTMMTAVQAPISWQVSDSSWRKGGFSSAVLDRMADALDY